MEWLLILVAMFAGFFGGDRDRAAESPDGRGAVVIPLDPPSEDELGRLPLVTRARGANPPLVVIDPGHGGRDPGAPAPFGSATEKDITLSLARLIRDDLARTGRVRVALTRDDDSYLLLEQRYGIAQRLGADLFISVHADAAPLNDQARGATVYTLSEIASDREAALLAARQNASGAIPGAQMSEDAGVNYILIDLAQRESMDRAGEFARLLYREAAPVFPFRPQWHRFAAFVVLKAPDIPSILFESGYLTNATDAAYIQSAAGQRQIADGMRRAIEAHFARRFLPGR
ncbi:MAG: N-acetylmuramoyl-L-alanine amidase family protein [Sphingosinicella sp.]